MRIFSLMLFGLFAIGCHGLADSDKQSFHSYDRKAVLAFLKGNHLQGSPYWIKRNASGDKLYVLLYDKVRPGEHPVVIVKTNGVSVTVVPGTTAFFNDGDELVAWSVDVKQGITFKNQFVLQLPQFAFFDVDPTGKYFLIGEKPNKTWVGSAEKPEISRLVATNFLGRKIFATERGLIVVGSVKRDGKYTSGGMLIENDKEKRFVVGKTFDFPSFGRVVDVSADGKYFVLQGKSDLLAGWHLYDTTTGKTKRLGFATQFGFFLNMDLLAVEQSKEKPPLKASESPLRW